MTYINHHLYQDDQCSKLSDNDLILGMSQAFIHGACDSAHHNAIDGWLATDKCFLFRYPSGARDHFNLRWFEEWCGKNRPKVLDRLHDLKLFW